MKKGVITSLIFLLSVFYLAGSVIATCNLDVSLLNQDPYPAIPGDYVKVVFQIDGLENTACGEVTFGIKEGYPFYLDPNVENPKSINSAFQKDYSSSSQQPYKLRVDENALDGENPIEIYYSVGSTDVIKEFNLTVEDTRADFEVNVKDYDYKTNALTLEILNIAEVDVSALRIEIPKQDEVGVKGANKVIVGDLDSNEYTTATFEAILPEGETKILINVSYEDSIGITREIQKMVDFDSSYFSDRNKDKKSQPYWLYILIIVGIAFFVWRKISKKKREKERMKKKGMI